MAKEQYKLVGGRKCDEVLTKYPDYRVFWRAGFAFRGAKEIEDNKQPSEVNARDFQGRVFQTFANRMNERYNWAAAIDIDIDHDKKEIHLNGFSENDLY